jgi:hypothetical protein
MDFEILGKCQGITSKEKRFLFAYARMYKAGILFTVSISQLAQNGLQWSKDSRVVLAKSRGELYLFERGDGIKLTSQGSRRTRLYAKLRIRGNDIKDGDLFIGRIEDLDKKKMIHFYQDIIPE